MTTTYWKKTVRAQKTGNGGKTRQLLPGHGEDGSGRHVA